MYIFVLKFNCLFILTMRIHFRKRGNQTFNFPHEFMLTRAKRSLTANCYAFRPIMQTICGHNNYNYRIAGNNRKREDCSSQRFHAIKLQANWKSGQVNAVSLKRKLLLASVVMSRFTRVLLSLIHI